MMPSAGSIASMEMAMMDISIAISAANSLKLMSGRVFSDIYWFRCRGCKNGFNRFGRGSIERAFDIWRGFQRVFRGLKLRRGIVFYAVFGLGRFLRADFVPELHAPIIKPAERRADNFRDRQRGDTRDD